MNVFFLVLEILLIIAAIILQIVSFSRTKQGMEIFAAKVKDALSDAKLKSMKFLRDDLTDSKNVQSLIYCKDYLSAEESEKADDLVDGKISAYEDIDLIDSPVLTDLHRDNEYRDVIVSTNSYLLKNKGVASDFGILQDICDRRVNSEDAELSESISTPLYLGLCGTFVGIVCGLLGFWRSGVTSMDNILVGVSIAMTASLLGLVLTLINKIGVYPKVSAKVEKYKNSYYDFIQRELMPSLSLGVAGSLASFKDVLGSFISKFGNNISGYAETARLMNQNLESEHAVLQEINNLNISQASRTIAQSFATLKDSSEDLAKFREYQIALNTTMDKASQVTSRMESIIGSFEEFISSLNRIATQAEATNALQTQFKESLETHFPTIKEHEVIWREQIDELGKDAKKSSEELQGYLKSSSEYIRNFVGDNTTFLSGLLDMKGAVEAVKQNSVQQASNFEAYRASMESLKASIDKLYDLEADNQSSVTSALKGLLETNTNPQYTAKLTEIAEALGRIGTANSETKAAVAALKESVQGLNSEVTQELSAQAKKIDDIGTASSGIRSDVDKVIDKVAGIDTSVKQSFTEQKRVLDDLSSELASAKKIIASQEKGSEKDSKK